MDIFKNRKAFVKYIAKSGNFTIGVSDSGEFTVNLMDCENFTVNIYNCKSYKINQQDFKNLLNADETEEKLEPCPLCGGKGRTYEGIPSVGNRIYCENEACLLGIFGGVSKNSQDAVRLWNMRSGK